MRYVSTRGEAPALDFVEVMLAGLARDGGLYVPETWPTLMTDTIAGFAGKPYAEVAVEVIKPFVGDGHPGSRSRPHGARGLRHLPPSGDRAADAARAQPVRARAVPRADARLQGPRHAAGRAADGPRAAATRRAHHHRGGDLGRHRRRRGRGVPRPRPGGRGGAVPARPHFRGAAAHDDHGAGRQRACASPSKAPSTIARRW